MAKKQGLFGGKGENSWMIKSKKNMSDSLLYSKT